MDKKVTVAASVAGWDPSGGAGLAADIKTFEAHHVRGMGICSAVTSQVDNKFYSLEWISANEVINQATALFTNYRINALKFGIVESFQIVEVCIKIAFASNPGVKVVWDPVLKASAGFDFHHHVDKSLLYRLCSMVTLVTPNLGESLMLFGTNQPGELREIVKSQGLCPVLLKGGHAADHSNDYLVEKTGVTIINGEKFPERAGKHGSGCVFSSAVCASLASGHSLVDACGSAKKYTERYLLSAPGMLGWHNLE